MKKLLLLSLFILASCGSGSSPETEYKDGLCGSEVVSDYNVAVLSCKYMNSRADIGQCEQNLVTFKSKYPNVNCTAAKSGSIDEEMQITEEHINSLITEVQNL